MLALSLPANHAELAEVIDKIKDLSQTVYIAEKESACRPQESGTQWIQMT